MFFKLWQGVAKELAQEIVLARQVKRKRSIVEIQINYVVVKVNPGFARFVYL